MSNAPFHSLQLSGPGILPIDSYLIVIEPIIVTNAEHITPTQTEAAERPRKNIPRHGLGS